MLGKKFYMFASDCVAIKKTYADVSLLLIGELTPSYNCEILLSLLEDIKKDLIAHYEKKSEPRNISDMVNPKVSGLHIDIPQSLLSKLTYRAANEKCSIDTLCVDYLAQGIFHNKSY